MPDIALIATADPVTGMPEFDVVLTAIPAGAGTVARDLSLDSGLDTSVYLSLFTDARDVDASDDRRGWWGDEFGAIGSQLWRLTRGKATDEMVSQAKTWTEEALAWMVTDGVAASVSATATRIGLYAISIIVQIKRPDFTAANFRYALNWAATG